MLLDLAFGVVATVMLASALFVVTEKDLVRAVLWLAVTLVATAVVYGLLQAPFLAAVQVFTYVGGVVTLMVFGVMVTQRHAGDRIASEGAGTVRGVLIASSFFAVIAVAASKTDLTPRSAAAAFTTKDIARSLLTENLFAFEAVSLLLLAAVIGAVVLARRRDPDPVTGKEGATLPPMKELSP